MQSQLIETIVQNHSRSFRAQANDSNQIDLNGSLLFYDCARLYFLSIEQNLPGLHHLAEPGSADILYVGCQQFIKSPCALNRIKLNGDHRESLSLIL